MRHTVPDALIRDPRELRETTEEKRNWNLQGIQMRAEEKKRQKSAVANKESHSQMKRSNENMCCRATSATFFRSLLLATLCSGCREARDGRGCKGGEEVEFDPRSQRTGIAPRHQKEQKKCRHTTRRHRRAFRNLNLARAHRMKEACAGCSGASAKDLLMQF